MNLLRWPIKAWLVAITVIVIVGTGFLMLAQAPASKAAPESDAPLDCLRCHTRVLRSHDKLGSGSEACWACHDSTKIGTLRLADGTRLPLANSSQLCGQCHPGRYDAWQEGAHGMPAREDGEPKLPDTEKLKCISCHDPHQPQMETAALDKPYSKPAAGEEGTLECLDCHVRVLKGHDKLGSGSEACWACHSNRIMGELHLAEGREKLSLLDYPQLCAQCHHRRYKDWVEGTHGSPDWKEGSIEVHGTEKVGCIGCHDPHQPQIVLSGITRPHPAPAPSPSIPPVPLLVALSVSLLVVITIGVVVLKERKWPWGE